MHLCNASEYRTPTSNCSADITTGTICTDIASYPVFKDSKKCLVSAVYTWKKFLRNLGNRVILVFVHISITHNHVILVFFCIMATCSDSEDEFLSSLALCIICTSEGYSDWKPWRNDHVVIVLYFLLRNDVLIENSKYGCIIMQNNRAMK